MNRYYRTPYDTYANPNKAFVQEYPVPLSAVGNIYREDNLSFFGAWSEDSGTSTTSSDDGGGGFDWGQALSVVGNIAGAVKAGYQNMNTTYKQLNSQTLNTSNQMQTANAGALPQNSSQPMTLPLIIGGGVLAIVVVILLVLKLKK